MTTNLPTDIKDLAKEIQASLAAEDPIQTAYLQAERDADDCYKEATDLAYAEYTKAHREARATFDVIEIPARNVRDAATKTAAKVWRKELDAVRIQTGHLLLAAKRKVNKGGWQAWCKANVKRSNGSVIRQSDIRAMIALVKSSDPVAAREAEKANTRARVQRHRAGAVTSTPVTAVPVALSSAMVEQAPLAVRPAPMPPIEGLIQPQIDETSTLYVAGTPSDADDDDLDRDLLSFRLAEILGIDNKERAGLLVKQLGPSRILLLLLTDARRHGDQFTGSTNITKPLSELSSCDVLSLIHARGVEKINALSKEDRACEAVNYLVDKLGPDDFIRFANLVITPMGTYEFGEALIAELERQEDALIARAHTETAKAMKRQ